MENIVETVVETDVEPAIVSGLNPGHIVEKSRPLMLLKNAPFSLEELKVLDTYLSRINARDPNHRTVRFSKSEYEELMGLQQVRPENLKKYIEKLYNTEIELTDESKPGWSDGIKLFTRRRTYQDKNGQWWVELSCSPEAKEYFFSVDTLGYFGYYLKNIIGITSMYSYALYMYVLMQGYRGTWEEDVDKLKEILNCTSERYQKFKFFNSEVLKKACAEVNEKTDTSFEYSLVKNGTRVTKIAFKVIKLGKVGSKALKQETRALDEPHSGAEQETDEKQIGLWDVPAEPDIDDPLAMVTSVLPDGFTREDAAILRNYALPHVPYTVMSFEEKAMWISDYIQEKVLLMNASNARKPVKNKMAWLKDAVENNWK